VPRISELEQRADDTLEVAISPYDFTRLGSATDPLELRATLLNGNGTEYGSFLLSTNPADWVQDPITLEYLLIHPIVGFGNHRTDWDGIVLSSTNATGLDTVEDALMIGPFNTPVDGDGALSETVVSATHIPVGTALTLIDQSNVVGSGSGASLLFEAPNINTPIVTTDDSLGSSGTTPPPCFTRKTLIRCATGEKPIEDLRVGDLVQTLSNGLQPIRWIGSVTFSGHDLIDSPRNRPIRIAAGALGHNIPHKDLLVSRQHRIVTNSNLTALQTGEWEVLIAAHRMIPLSRISLVQPKNGITYMHLLFDRHEVIFANGAAAESLYCGDQLSKMLPQTSLLEIEALGQVIGQHAPALAIPTGKEQKDLVLRHMKQGEYLCKCHALTPDQNDNEGFLPLMEAA